MKIPDKTSRTKVCAPRPSATPTTPADAISGPKSKPNSPNAIAIAMIQIATFNVADRTPPIVLARSFWRATMLRGPGTKSAEANLFIARVIVRDPKAWANPADTRMIRTRRGVPAIHSRKVRKESFIMTRLYPNIYQNTAIKYRRPRVF